MDKGYEKAFHRKYQCLNYRKGCKISLIIRDIEIQTLMQAHISPIKLVKIQMYDEKTQ